MKAPIAFGLLLVASIGAPPASAERLINPEGVGWELAPVVGYRFGGSFDDGSLDEDPDVGSTIDLDDGESFGMLLEFPSGPTTQWQIFYSRQATQIKADATAPVPGTFDVDIEYLHLAGSYVMAGEGRVRPFIGVGFGATRMSPAGDYGDELEPSLLLMGGLKYRINERLGVRLDLRAISTLTDADSAIFCSGGCIATYESD
ncbi:MAG: porin family protein, partial [Gammaproteobacteria bacterium]|nr:porin family protein [Gammaproteobacteria bacterium]